MYDANKNFSLENYVLKKRTFPEKRLFILADVDDRKYKEILKIKWKYSTMDSLSIWIHRTITINISG